MRLTRVDVAVEDGWLRSTSTVRGIREFALGGDSQAVANEWRWADGTLFWQGAIDGAAVGGAFTNWSPFGDEPSTSGGCVQMKPGDSWQTGACAAPVAYVCERY